MNVPFAFTVLTVSVLFPVGLMIFNILRFNNQLKNGLKVSGTLVGYKTKTSYRGPDSYHPIVEFKTILGETIRESSIYGASDQKFEENSEVGVIYQPNDPRKFFVEGQNPAKFFYVGILVFVATYSYLVYKLHQIDPAFFAKLLHV